MCQSISITQSFAYVPNLREINWIVTYNTSVK